MEFNYSIRPSCKECPYKATGGSKCRALEEDVCQKDIWFHASKLELKNILRDPLAEHGLSQETKDLIKDLLGE